MKSAASVFPAATLLALLGLIELLAPPAALAQIRLGITTQPASALTITGNVGTAVQVQSAGNFSTPSPWSHMTNLVLTASSTSVKDPNGSTAGNRFYRAVALPSPDMVLVPEGSFQMGDTFSEGAANELPVHTVQVSAFFMERSEVTWQLWQSVYVWALTNGYNLDKPGQGKASNHPVHTINWFDAVKWCNARSEKEKLTPAYYMDALVTVYRVGQAALRTNHVNWKASGYRLPTEAEWEHAARGGSIGQRFPWGDTITHLLANYYSATTYSYDLSATRGYDPSYATGGMPYTNPIDAFAANRHGLYGMSDNITEWCWDWFDAAWYASAAASQANPRGPRGDSLTYRVRRGGAWNLQADKARSAYRDFGSPTDATSSIGFRCVRGL